MNKDITVGAAFETGWMYSISPGNKTFTYRGGEIIVRVTAKGPGSCPAPGIVNLTDWITYTLMPFTGNKGSIKLSIPEYTCSTVRYGEIAIGGNMFTATQEGKP